MSVRPIDLQTLFSHINQVGKDQAVEKNAAALQQDQQARHLIQETEQKDHSINETKKAEEGLEGVGSKEQHPAAKEERKRRKERKREEEKRSQNFFRDPDLGHNIDLEG